MGDFYTGYWVLKQARDTIVWPLGEGGPWPSISGWGDSRWQTQGLAEGRCTNRSDETLGRLDEVARSQGFCFNDTDVHLSLVGWKSRSSFMSAMGTHGPR